MFHSRSKFEVSTFSRFKVIAFSVSCCQTRNFARKKHRDFRRKASRKSQKLTFTTFRPTYLESFFHKFEVIAFLCTYSCLYIQRKNCSFFEKRFLFAHHGESFTRPILLLISSREAGCEYKLFSKFGLTRPVIEPKSTVSAADALSTRPTIKNDKINSVA